MNTNTIEFIEARLRFILGRLPKEIALSEEDGFSKYMLHYLNSKPNEVVLENEHLEESFARIFGCKKEEVVLVGDRVYINGALYYQNYDELSTYRLVAKYPEYQTEISKIVGYMRPNLSNLTNADGIVFPQVTSGPVFLTGIEQAKDVVCPVIVGGDFYLSRLIKASNVKVPKIVMGSMFLSQKETLEEIDLPQFVGETCYLDSMYVDKIDSTFLPNPLTYSIYCRDDVLITPENVSLYRRRIKY